MNNTDRLHAIEVPGRDIVGPVKAKRMSQRAFREAFDSVEHYVFVPAHGDRSDARFKVCGAVSAAAIAHSYDVPVTIWPADEQRPTLED